VSHQAPDQEAYDHDQSPHHPDRRGGQTRRSTCRRTDRRPAPGEPAAVVTARSRSRERWDRQAASDQTEERSGLPETVSRHRGADLSSSSRHTG